MADIDAHEFKEQQIIRLRNDLFEAERRYVLLVDNIPDVVYSMDEHSNFIKLNKSVSIYGYTQEELIGHSFIELVYPDDQEEIAVLYMAIIAERKDGIRTQQFRFLTKSGEVRWFEANYTIRFSPRGEFLLHEGVCRDITESVQTKDLLLKNSENLEAQVNIRTNELMRVNEALQKEIVEHVQAEIALREREADLEMEKANLQEANTALKVLLKRREMDKRALEEQVMYNVRELIHPYLEKLKALDADERQQAYLSIIESNLADITNAFSRRLSLEFYGLTKSELKVANFIRQGVRSNQMSLMLGLSVRTVEAYRNSIRHKLRIKNKKVNLRTFLMSIN